MTNEEGQVVTPAPPVRCHGDQRFWRAGRIMFELSREHGNMSFSCTATHWHSRSLLVLHKIDLNKARASLTWKEMERLPPLSSSALLKQFVHRSLGGGIWVAFELTEHVDWTRSYLKNVFIQRVQSTQMYFWPQSAVRKLISQILCKIGHIWK